MDVLDRNYAKKLASGIKSITVNSANDGLLFITNSGTRFDVKLPNFHSHINLTILEKFSYDSTNNLLLYDGKPIVSGSSGTTNYVDLTDKPSINGVELTGNKTLADLGITNYNDTQIKKDITDLQNNKVDKVTGKSLIDDTEIARLALVDNYDDKAIKASIKTVADGLMASAGYSPDYKKLDIITVGGTKKSIDLLPIISHSKITELSDVDSTNQGNGKTLVYNSATGKHEYVDSSSTDELVKMDSTSTAKHLGDLIDKTTIVNDNGTLVAKTLDGLTASITELNYIKGLQMPVQDLVTAFANGGLKTIDTPFPTYADLQSYDVSTLLDDIRYLVRVLADETHDGKITAYLIKKGQTAPTFYGYLSDSRDFTINPIDLVNEITGKLKAKNIDADDLFALLTISDVYKTATAKDEIFGTNGAKAMYDELNTAIGKKANNTDLTTHTGDTDIHTSTTEKDTWNTVTDKASKSDLTSHTGDTNIHITTAERTAWNNKANSSDLTSHTSNTNIHVTTSDKTKWNKVDNKADKTDLTSHTTNTNIHITTAERTKWNKVDNKVDKTSILTAISASPSDSNLLSEKAIKSELDKKSSITELNNLSQGILVTETSMNKNILLWDVGHYYFNANYAWQAYEHIPNTAYAPHVYVTSVNPIKYKDINLNGTDTKEKSWFRQIKVEDHLGNSFIRTIYTTNIKALVDLENGKLLSSGSDTGWQRVSTSVADVPVTDIKFTSTTNYKPSTNVPFMYTVSNGICYVSGGIQCVSPKDTDTQVSTLPKPKVGRQYCKTMGVASVSGDTNTISMIVGVNGELQLAKGVASGEYRCTFSYPVKES